MNNYIPNKLFLWLALSCVISALSSAKFCKFCSKMGHVCFLLVFLMHFATARRASLLMLSHCHLCLTRQQKQSFWEGNFQRLEKKCPTSESWVKMVCNHRIWLVARGAWTRLQVPLVLRTRSIRETSQLVRGIQADTKLSKKCEYRLNNTR